MVGRRDRRARRFLVAAAAAQRRSRRLRLKREDLDDGSEKRPAQAQGASAVRVDSTALPATCRSPHSHAPCATVAEKRRVDLVKDGLALGEADLCRRKGAVVFARRNLGKQNGAGLFAQRTLFAAGNTADSGSARGRRGGDLCSQKHGRSESRLSAGCPALRTHSRIQYCRPLCDGVCDLDVRHLTVSASPGC